MTGDQTASLLFALLCLILVGSSLLARRQPWGQTLKYAGAWVLIFAVGLVLFSFREEAGQVGAKVMRQISPPTPVISGGEVRILRGEDDHFHVDAVANGQTIRLLVDTGATTTSISRATAAAAGIDVSESGYPVMVQTANGTTMMRRARIAELRIGSIAVPDVAVLVSDQDDLNVLGMNVLSKLSSWRVEGRELILKP